MLWAYYRVPSAHFGRPDRIYPTFIVTRMPHGISGLLIAAILAAAMSNLSAALNSLSSTAIMDFYARLRPRADEKTKMRLSRLATLAWALVLFALAVDCSAQSRTRRRGRPADRFRRLRRSARSFPSRRADPPRPPDAEPWSGWLCGFAADLYLWLGTRLPWTWWVHDRLTATFAVGWTASCFAGKSRGPTTS